MTDVTESNTAFLCVGIPQCQHIARPVILRCAKTLSLSVYKTGTLIFFLLLPHNHATASRREERIETYTNGVWCEALTIKNINGKKVVIFILMILRLVYNKYGESILLRYLGIKVQISLSYAIQSCELRQNWQCQEWFF